MELPRNILYPVDFSERCQILWPAVAAMARQLDAPVTLLHAFDFERLDDGSLSSELATIREHLRDRLRQFPTPGLDVPTGRRELAEGPAARCIVEMAGKMDAAMMMMPTRGWSRFRELLLGSVTAAVLHDALCPVWTEAHRAEKPAPIGVSRASVCALELAPTTPAVMQAATAFSKAFGVPLHVVHSVSGIDPRFPSATADRAHEFLIAQAREDFPRICEQAGLDIRLEIVEEVGLALGIERAVIRHDADLLVIGRGAIQGPLGRLRTNAHTLIRHSPCAVLSV
jgi:nucleotide-binding universal stress UspA family protein